MLKLTCPTCRKEVEDITAHFASNLSCESAFLQKAEAEKRAGEERMRRENPAQYEALQMLRSLTPAAGTDPDFDYEKGVPKK